MKPNLRESVLKACIIGSIGIGFFFPVHAEDKKSDPIKVIAASATSYGEGSSSVICLLDKTCKGDWIPRSQDAGVNEGIAIRFEKPAHFGAIEIIIEGNVERGKLLLKPYFDGATGGDAGQLKYRGEKTAEENKRLQKAIERQRQTEEFLDEVPDIDFLGNSGNRIFIGYGEATEEGNTRFIVHYAENLPVKSFFLKYEAALGKQTVKIKKINFYSSEVKYSDSLDKLTPLELVLPVIEKAHVDASSMLSPRIAYGPEHLFDSQFDMAWSTDGSKSNGIGESITVKFDQNVDIAGLVLWNGYQRSQIHYQANGRIRKLKIGKEIITVRDQIGEQKIMLKNALNTDTVTLTIADIFKGDAYKDVLISELRFLDSKGRLILPQVEAEAETLPDAIAFLQDRTYSSFIKNALREGDEIQSDTDSVMQCSSTSLRVRSNGTFVIYADYLDGQVLSGTYTPGVIEGNWTKTERNNEIGIFGKRYRIPIPEQIGYMALTKTAEAVPKPRMFRSKLTATPFNKLSEAEQKNALSFVLDKRFVPNKNAKTLLNKETRVFLNIMEDNLKDNPDFSFWDFDAREIQDENYKGLFNQLFEKNKELNPVFIRSDIYTDLLLPQESVGPCFY